MHMIDIFLSWVDVVLSCFKWFPSSFALVMLPSQLNVKAKQWSFVLGGLVIDSNNSLDFHDEI